MEHFVQCTMYLLRAGRASWLTVYPLGRLTSITDINELNKQFIEIYRNRITLSTKNSKWVWPSWERINLEFLVKTELFLLCFLNILVRPLKNDYLVAFVFWMKCVQTVTCMWWLLDPFETLNICSLFFFLTKIYVRKTGLSQLQLFKSEAD